MTILGLPGLSARVGPCNRASQPEITSNSCRDLKIFQVHHDLVKAQGTFSDLSFSEIDVEQYAVVLLFNVLLQSV